VKIVYHSAAPWIHTGYATCTEEIATRLHNSGHEVALQCLSSVKNKPIWWHGEDADCELEQKMKIYPANSKYGLEDVTDHFEDFNADIYFTHFDTWMKEARQIIPEMDIPYVSYVIVDHEPAPDAVITQVSNATETIAMSEFAKHELEKKGLRPIQIPHGIDTSQYRELTGEDKPTDIEVSTPNESESTRKVDLDDVFLMGMVAANHGSRKNIPNHLEAFKRFIEEVDDDAILYLHTDQVSSEGYNLHRIAKQLNIPDENLLWARGTDYGEVGNEYLNMWYNAFDVFLNCSFGESWGLTVTEAQATGTPAIVSNFSSLTEQLGISPYEQHKIHWLDMHPNVGVAEHGLVCDPVANFWKTKVDAKHKIVNSETIFKAMRFYYTHENVRKTHGEKAKEYVTNNYTWEDDVLPKFFDLFDMLEESVL